jgi:hypothetical protein
MESQQPFEVNLRISYAESRNCPPMPVFCRIKLPALTRVIPPPFVIKQHRTTEQQLRFARLAIMSTTTPSSTLPSGLDYTEWDARADVLYHFYAFRYFE